MEAWVTAVGNEDEVVKACRLALSLKRVHTAKSVVALVTRKVSSHGATQKLRSAFDHVLPLAFDDFDGGLLANWRDDVKEEVEAAAKIRVVSMTVFRKCVYLCVNFEAVTNCDDIFNKYGSLGLAEEEIGGGVDPGIVVVAPSSHFYTEMVAQLWADVGEDIATVFRNWALAKVESKVANILPRDEIVRIRGGEVGIPANRAGWRFIQWIGEQTGDVDEMEKFLEESKPGKKDVDGNEPIAIVGLSLRLPGANTPDEFWDLIFNGKEAIKPVPDGRWKPEATGTHNADRNIEAGFLDCAVDEADARFFGWNSAELEYLDPQQILLHEVVWEALEDGGVIPSQLESTRTGIFVGEWIRNAETIAGRMPGVNLLRGYLGTSLATAAGRLAHFLGTTGPALGIETACSSSLIALHLACTSLTRKECEVAIAGGANLILEPFPRSSAVTEGILAKDGRCKTFDASADGFGRAEGVAAVVLKRLSDAVRNGDRIWGVVRGSAVVQEGTSRSLGTPTVESESLVMELALKAANIPPKDVTIVEVHGTGTPVGDPVEVAAIKKVYSKGRTKPLLIGSVKTNIGHTEAVAGLASVIKILLAMREGVLPPHRHLVRLNPAIELDSIPAKIPLSPEPWNRVQDRPRVAGVSAFGMSGSGGHVILEEPPRSYEPLRRLQAVVSDRPLQVLKLSAKSRVALEQLLERYASHLDEVGGDLADISFSANTGRATFPHRAVVVAKDALEAAEAIRSRSFQQCDLTATPTSPICFLFTGHGAHYHGMAMKLYGSCPPFQAALEQCAQILQEKHGINLENLKESSTLTPARCGAIAGFCVQYALFRMWHSWGVRPDFVLGHSMGEICAAVAVSALSLEEALHLIIESVCHDGVPDGKMLVLNEGRERVAELLKEFESNNLTDVGLDIAVTNSATQTVVAGYPDQIDAFAEYSKGIGLAVQLFSVGSTAFHSRLMETLLKPYRRVLSTLNLPPQRNLKGPKYISAIEGRQVELDHLDVDYWVRHLREEVRFDEACRAVKREGCNLFLEMGAHPVLSAFTVANVEGAVCLPSLRRKMDDWTVVAGTVAQLWLSPWKGELNWRAWDGCYSRTKVDLPKYPFIRQKVPLPGLIIGQKEVHPLLGHSLPTPLESHYIFQSSLALRKAPFLGDFGIGWRVVFPEVGFLEMCLAGGHHLLQVNEGSSSKIPPRRSLLLVKDLIFCSPLSLRSTEGGVTVLQTVIKPANNITTSGGKSEIPNVEYCVSIYSRLDPTANSVTGQWIRHATASIFSTLPDHQLEEVTTSSIEFDLEKAKQSWASVSLTTIYEEFSDAGLHLGSTFQMLSNLWKEENQTLFQLKIGIGTEVEPEYMMHPAALDAMIQALLISEKGDAKLTKLHVPLKIGMFAWTPSTCERNDLHLGGGYVHTWVKPGSGARSCRLINSSGDTVARMGGVEFLETRADFVEAKVASICDGTEARGGMMPKLWKEVWRTVPDELEQSLRSEVFPEGQSGGGWLIFDKNGVGGKIRQKLETLGRKVFLCQRPAEVDLLGENGETIVRGEVYNAMVSARAKVEFLEGVVYLWALKSESTITPMDPVREQRLSTLPLLALMQTMIMLDDPPQVVVLTQGAAIVEDYGVVNPSTSPITAMVRSVANEVEANTPGLLCLRHLDLDPGATSESQVELIVNSMLIQSKSSSFQQLACRDGCIFTPKLVSAVEHNEALRLPRGSARFQVTPSKKIEDLQFTSMNPFHSIAEDEVEVAVKAVGLGSEDVVAITVDTEQFARNICGVVVKIGAKVTRWAIGDRVVGKRCSQDADKLLASHLRFQERSLVRLPSGWTLWEGSTIPLFSDDDNMGELERSLVDGHRKAPSFQRFDALNIRGALEYLSQMPKVGNVVLVMPEVGLEKGELKATTPLFTPDSTYLVTGGLTGIGFEVVKWLLASGAKYIAIASRRGRSPEAEVELQKYKDPDCCIRSFKVDVGNRRELEEWITHLTNSDSGFPPIRGVFHCAGLLSNAMFPNLSWDMCETTFQPKIDGTWHLHELTKHMPLEYFVLTSSIASKCAFIGHLNYSAANAFQDAVIAHRHHLGLPGTVVNWGQWGEVGMAKDFQLPGIRPMSPAEGIRALDTFLRTATHSIIADNVDSFNVYQKTAPFLKDYVEDQNLLEDIKEAITVSHLDTNKFWEEFDSTENKEGRIHLLSQFVKRTLTTILQLGSGNAASNDFNFDTDFQSLGADSLVLLEFRSELQKLMGSRLPLTSAAELRHANTPNELSTRLLQALDNSEV